MTPAEAKKIRAKCAGMVPYLNTPHPLDGKSVSQWVAEARAGWPRPIRYNPTPAALKKISAHADYIEG